MKIFKKKSLLQGSGFMFLVLFTCWVVVFAALSLYWVSREGTPFSIIGGVCLLFALLGVVVFISVSRTMNYVVIDGDRIIFVNAINPYFRDDYDITEMSRVVFDVQFSEDAPDTMRIGLRYMSFYIAQQKQRYILNMINNRDYSLIIEELESRGVAVECSTLFCSMK